MQPTAVTVAGASSAQTTAGTANNNTKHAEVELEVEAKVSDVLIAMQVPHDFAVGTLRLSFGRHTTVEDIDVSVESIVSAVKLCWWKMAL